MRMPWTRLFMLCLAMYCTLIPSEATAVYSNCEKGRWGQNCENQCENCLEDECNSVTGSCYRCQSGYFGLDCNMTCPETCQSDSDNIKWCSRITGVCMMSSGDKVATFQHFPPVETKTFGERLIYALLLVLPPFVIVIGVYIPDFLRAACEPKANYKELTK